MGLLCDPKDEAQRRSGFRWSDAQNLGIDFDDFDDFGDLKVPFLAILR